MPKQKSSEVSETVAQVPQDQGLMSLAEMGQQYARELAIQEELEKAIAESRIITTRLAEVAIPEKMTELGLEEFKLKTGDKVTLQPVFGASVPDARKPEAWAWLRQEGHGSLIKSKIDMSYGMGEEAKQEAVIRLLTANYVDFRLKEDVHAATLKAFVTEQYESGKKFPEALFGAFTKTIARIKKSK